MATMHLVTSMLAGGQTGKTTVSFMLTAHLAALSHVPTIVLIDASNDQRLYNNMHAAFSSPDLFALGRHDAFFVNGANGQPQIICVRPAAALGLMTDPANVIKLIQEARTALAEAGLNEKDMHFICETNLPNAAAVGLKFLRTIRKLGDDDGAKIPLLIWTTWNTYALADGRAYDNLETLEPAMTNANAAFMFVHNPYSMDSKEFGGDVSPTMKQCHALPLEYAASNAGSLYEACGRPAYEASQAQAGNFETIWQQSYAQFISNNGRPQNVLPVFRDGSGWRALLQGQFAKLKVTQPRELGRVIDQACNNFFSQVFKPYFIQVIG